MRRARGDVEATCPRKGDGACAHWQVKHITLGHCIGFARRRDATIAANIDYPHLAAVKDAGRAAFLDLIQRQAALGGHSPPYDHAIVMSIDQANFARLKHPLAMEVVAQGAGVHALCFIG